MVKKINILQMIYKFHLVIDRWLEEKKDLLCRNWI
jgi:hypothetical protein